MLTCLVATVFVSSRAFAVGDGIVVTCANDPSISVRRIVGVDGSISVPQLGSFFVLTRSATWLKEKLEAEGKHLLERNLELEITTYLPSEGFVHVKGLVESQLTLRLDPKWRVADLLRIARPSKDADMSKVKIVHMDGTEESINTDSKQPLQVGDEVTVQLSTESHSIGVVGGVGHAGSVPFESGLSVANAIKQAGGFGPQADQERVLVIRGSEQIPIDLPHEAGFALKPGDIIKVELLTYRDHVKLKGNVVRVGLVAFKSGMTLIDALRAAGGPKPNTPNDLVLLTRIAGPGNGTRRIDIRALYTRRVENPKLMKNDVIEVRGR